MTAILTESPRLTPGLNTLEQEQISLKTEVDNLNRRLKQEFKPKDRDVGHYWVSAVREKVGEFIKHRVEEQTKDRDRTFKILFELEKKRFYTSVLDAIGQRIDKEMDIKDVFFEGLTASQLLLAAGGEYGEKYNFLGTTVRNRNISSSDTTHAIYEPISNSISMSHDSERQLTEHLAHFGVSGSASILFHEFIHARQWQSSAKKLREGLNLAMLGKVVSSSILIERAIALLSQANMYPINVPMTGLVFGVLAWSGTVLSLSRISADTEAREAHAFYSQQLFSEVNFTEQIDSLVDLYNFKKSEKLRYYFETVEKLYALGFSSEQVAQLIGTQKWSRKEKKAPLLEKAIQDKMTEMNIGEEYLTQLREILKLKGEKRALQTRIITLEELKKKADIMFPNDQKLAFADSSKE